MSDPQHAGVVTHICPKCSFVWTYPNQFEYACPGCGTSHPALTIDLLAERSEALARGEDPGPVISEPPMKDSPLRAEFNSGVERLRLLIVSTKATVERMSRKKKVQGLEDKTVRLFVEANLERMIAAERLISAIYLEGNDPEGFVSNGTRFPDSGLLPHNFSLECPNAWCAGELAQGNPLHKMVCSSCDQSWTKIDLLSELFVPNPDDWCPKCQNGRVRLKYQIGLGATYLICDACEFRWDAKHLP